MGLRDNFTKEEQEEIIASGMRNLGLKRPDVEKFIESRERPIKRNALLDAQWVRNIHLVCEAMREGEADPAGLYASVFWIHLYGVLNDLRRAYRGPAQMYEEIRALGRDEPFIAACAGVFDACEALYESLSDDELVFITFLRHVNAHVYQNSFEYEIERGNPEQNPPATVRTKQHIGLLRRHVGVDEAHEIVDRISGKYAHDDVRVAVNFAHKVGPFIEKLREAMNTLRRERESAVAESAAWRARKANRLG